MKFTLDKYMPIGTEVLLKPNIKTHSEGGVILGQEKVDRWFEVIKVGTMVSDVIQPGDYVIFDMGGSPQMNLTFEEELYIQINMHSIKGKVQPVGLIASIDNVTTT